MSLKHSIRWPFAMYGAIALVLCLLGMGLPAISNPAPASAEPNISVCAPNVSFGVLDNGQLRKINTGDNPGSEKYGDVNLKNQYPLSDYKLRYTARQESVNGLAVASDGQAFYAFRGWANGNGSRNNFDLFKYDANGNNPQRIQLTKPEPTNTITSSLVRVRRTEVSLLVR